MLINKLEIYTLFPPSEAENLAHNLTANDEDDWSYIPVHDPTGKGKSFIQVYDEDNNPLGKL